MTHPVWLITGSSRGLGRALASAALEAGDKMPEDLLTFLFRRARLLLQEFAPHLVLLTLPGGYFIALFGLVHRHWPPTSLRS